jgi:acyl-CoA reductase-like NAD-dependent aldehyde dehydrogenase
MAELRVDDPFTGELACAVPLAEWDEIGRALDRAREGAALAAALPLEARKRLVERAVRVMESRSDAIAPAISRMMGKPLAQAAGELRTLASRARTMLELADRGSRRSTPAAATESRGASRRCRSGSCWTCPPGTTRCSPP